MHLTNLGVMRKPLIIWVLKGPSNVKLSGKKILQLSESLVKLKEFIPSEYRGKPNKVQGILR